MATISTSYAENILANLDKIVANSTLKTAVIKIIAEVCNVSIQSATSTVNSYISRRE